MVAKKTNSSPLPSPHSPAAGPPAPRNTSAWSGLSPPQRRIVACVRRLGPCNRERLGLELHWSPSAISKIVSPLVEQCVLLSVPPGTRRRNAQLSAAPELGFAIGIELGFERVYASVVDFNGNLVGLKREYRPDRISPDAFLQCMKKTIRELLAQPFAQSIMGIGIGYADRASWNVAEAFANDHPGKTTAPWRRALETAFDLPVIARCDAACGALGEWRKGRLRGVENGLFLMYRDGIGLGIIAAGHVVFGDVNDAGEIGHLPMDDEGEYCHCGNVGCLETIASKWALTKKAKWIFEAGGQVNFRRAIEGRPPELDDLCAMAMAGDLLARNMLVKAGRALGRALAISGSLFDPAMIVLGGCLSSPELYAPLIAATREGFQTLAAHRTPQPIKFETSELGENAPLIGAAELVFSEVLR